MGVNGLVVFGGLFIYAKLVETGTMSWTLAATSFVLGALVMLPLIRTARWVGLTFGCGARSCDARADALGVAFCRIQCAHGLD
jgi:hypothetical protein